METKFKIIIPGKNSRLMFLETTSFATALRGASAMGGYVQRTSDGKYYQDVSLVGEVWNPSLKSVIAYHDEMETISAEVDAIIESYISGQDLGDVA
jgi:hypothetical protein